MEGLLGQREAQLEGHSSSSGMRGNSISIIMLNPTNENHKDNLTFAYRILLSHK
jgi:hypothetical protein